MSSKNIQLFITLFFVSIFLGNSQIKKENIKLGLAFGTGTQSSFPFNASDYTHEVKFYKAVVNYKLKQKNKWNYEINIEPSFNVAKHQLKNKWFVKPEDYDNYLELRDLYTQERTLKEYVLNIGFITRYALFENASMYALGSVGPMIGDIGTERLAKGFAFSDVFGLGTSYVVGKTQLDFRYSVRHTSNLQMKIPNNGHNTTNIEFAVLLQL
ncbi:MAG: acyloxyacyl hydrolase [Algibacter sp.]